MSQVTLQAEPEARRIVIVGGGTAGWLAAWVIRERLGKLAPAELVMVESSKIPTIGVGEGTTALFKAFLDHFALDEAEFLRDTRATIKLGIRHRSWGAGAPYYDGPLDDPHWQGDVPGKPGSELLNVYAIAEGKRVSQSHHFAHLMRADKVPFVKNGDASVSRNSEFENAYHFDNARVAAWLRRKAPELAVIDAVVDEVVTDAAGAAITALRLDSGELLEGDFFIDCTGFRRLLIGALPGLAWRSYADELPLNRAFPFQLPHQPGAPVIPYTHAWAQNCGWMWQIPTQDRIGNGYAYCDEFATPEQAHAEIEKALGTQIEPLADIRFEVGRLERTLEGNCLAVGLSAGFLEPLEATSIHSTLIQLLVLDRDYLADVFGLDESQRDGYNATIGRLYDDFRTFLVMHYRGERADTPFWRHIKASCAEAKASARLREWQEHLPRKDDFDGFLGGLPHVEAQLYYPILDGLGLVSRELARQELASSNLATELARCWRTKLAEAKEVAAKALSHRALLAALDAGAPIELPRPRRG